MAGWDSSAPSGDGWNDSNWQPDSNGGAADAHIESSFTQENTSKHDAGPDDAPDGGCRICHQDGHFARDCPEKGEGGGNSGLCYNCGEEGHNKADCVNPRVEREFTGTCRVCEQEGHRAAECPQKPPPVCRACQAEGHAAAECTANRMHAMFTQLKIDEKSAQDAWDEMVAADKEKDIEDIKKSIFAYAKAFPEVTFEELEDAFRADNMNTFLIAKEQPISDTHTIVNLQGQPDQKFVVSFQFSDKPKRAKFAEGWPSSSEENRTRLAEAGLVMDGLVPKCSNCNELGHTSKKCEQEKQGPANSVAITCANCEGEGHRARDCVEPRKSNKRGCKICESEEHLAKDCPDKQPGICRNCGEEGHRKDECTNERRMQCRNCDEWGHAGRDCPLPRDMAKVQCRNCDEMGHDSRGCKLPTDWSRVECTTCKQKGHSHKRCTMKEGEVVDTGDAGGDGEWAAGGASSGGRGGSWEGTSGTPAEEIGGGW